MQKEKIEMRRIIKKEKEIYKTIGYKNRIHSLLTQCEVGKIFQYIVLLRKEEYFISIMKRKKIYLINFFINKRKKNKLGLKLGINIPPNVFKEGILIYHSNGIVINKNCRVGKNCKIHGDLCIGNNGITEDAPIIGDDVDIGIGAKIIGKVTIADNVKIGANAVVTKSFLEKDSVVVGVPATKIK